MHIKASALMIIVGLPVSGAQFDFMHAYFGSSSKDMKLMYWIIENITIFKLSKYIIYQNVYESL